MSNLRTCCQKALLDGKSPREHFDECDARAEDPPMDALFDLPDQPKQGGQHL